MSAETIRVVDLNNEQSVKDWLQSLNDRLQEKGLSDEKKCQLINNLTEILNNDTGQNEKPQSSSKSYHQCIDDRCLGTILENLDLRQSQLIRSHVVLTISAYLNAADTSGSEKISKFLLNKIQKGSSDDLTVAFSVATCLYPVIPDHISTLILKEGFIPSLEPLMKKKWKDEKVEQALLEMLNVACMNTDCRDAIRNHCLEWLTEKVQSSLDVSLNDKYTKLIKDFAAIILAKLQVGEI